MFYSTGGKLPTRGSKYSACVDLYAKEDCSLLPGTTTIINLGVWFDAKEFYKNLPWYVKMFSFFSEDYFMKTHYLLLEPRSGFRAKGLIVGSGIIDMDYIDEFKLIIHNPLRVEGTVSIKNILKDPFVITKGDKVAQVTVLKHKSNFLNIFSDVKRDGGLGSTGN